MNPSRRVSTGVGGMGRVFQIVDNLQTEAF
jgi:hypothetical protein